GHNLSNTLSTIAEKQFKVDIEFEKLEFQLFPPGANVKNIYLKKVDENYSFDITLGRLGIYFNLLDSFKTKLTIKELFLEDSIIQIKTTSTTEIEKQSGEGLKDPSISKLVEAMRRDLPVNVSRFVVKKS